MIVPFPPGGVADTVARPVAEAMSRDLKQPVVIENKPGAGGGIGMAQAAKAKPDGYTVLLSLSSLTVLPEADKILGRAPAYQLDQLKPIARFTADPTVFVVRAEAPWKTLQDFIDDARANPGKFTYGSSGNYGTMHVPMEMFGGAAGVKMTHVPYTGAGPAIVGPARRAGGCARHRPGVDRAADQGRQGARAGAMGRRAPGRAARRAEPEGDRAPTSSTRSGRGCSCRPERPSPSCVGCARRRARPPATNA